MNTLDIIIIISAAIASLTKIIDVITTIKYVGLAHESNPLGRRLFTRFGVKGGCWITFAVQALLVGVLAWETTLNGNLLEKISYVVVAALLTWGNISAGLLNAYHRTTPITRVMVPFYCWLSRKLKT